MRLPGRGGLGFGLGFGFGAAALVAALVATLVAPAGAVPPGADDNPLQVAGKAAEQVAFVGVLEVRWAEDGSDHTETLLVHGGNGSVVVKGGTNVVASAEQRLVEHAGRWDLLSPVGGGGAASRPAPTVKYQLSSADGPVITNRTTHAVEVRHGTTVLERLYLDSETGLLLRREHFDGPASAPSRTIQFDTIQIGAGTPVPNVPDDVRDASPKPVSDRRLPDGVSAPPSLAGGYQRVGIYRNGGVTQVQYSDGLYDVSVFQQPGRIDRGDLPAGSAVTFGKETARRYSWTGNHILLWEEKGMVYTAVSDAPLSQVVAAVGSLPLDKASPAIVRRLRQVARALVQPFAA